MRATRLNRSGWDPFTEFHRLRSEMNHLFDDYAAPAARMYPPVNFWLGDDSVVVTAELPGLSSRDVDLAVQDDTLSISGEYKAGPEQGNWHRRERPTGSFSRTINLPFRIDPDQVLAQFEHGVLEIEMRRPESDKPRKIAVNGN